MGSRCGRHRRFFTLRSGSGTAAKNTLVIGGINSGGPSAHTDVLPLLNNQKGFRQDMTLLGGNNGMSISVWDDRACAETYNTKTYPEVLKKLQPVPEGTPRVDTYDTMFTLIH